MKTMVKQPDTTATLFRAQRLSNGTLPRNEFAELESGVCDLIAWIQYLEHRDREYKRCTAFSSGQRVWYKPNRSKRTAIPGIVDSTKVRVVVWIGTVDGRQKRNVSPDSLQTVIDLDEWEGLAVRLGLI